MRKMAVLTTPMPITTPTTPGQHQVYSLYIHVNTSNVQFTFTTFYIFIFKYIYCQMITFNT